ncbi:hypothetical protein MKX01_033827 [Papaver californicum]|nr:hypothetical protein MKX01_033827 [Papaver californicum]
MQTAKEKLSNVASAAKEHAKIYKAKVDEKAEKAAATTPEEKEIAHQRRKAIEAEANMEFHAAKAEHKAETLDAKYSHHHNPITGHHDTYGHHNPLTGHTDPITGHHDTYGHHEVPLVGAHGHGHHHMTTATTTTPTTTPEPAYPILGHHHQTNKHL